MTIAQRAADRRLIAELLRAHMSLGADVCAECSYAAIQNIAGLVDEAAPTSTYLCKQLLQKRWPSSHAIRSSNSDSPMQQPHSNMHPLAPASSCTCQYVSYDSYAAFAHYKWLTAFMLMQHNPAAVKCSLSRCVRRAYMIRACRHVKYACVDE